MMLYTTLVVRYGICGGRGPSSACSRFNWVHNHPQGRNLLQPFVATKMFFHLSSLVLLLGSLQQGALAYLPIEFDIADAKSPTNLRGLDFVSRLTVPYGPDIQSNPPQTGSDQPYKGYGFGMVSSLANPHLVDLS